MIKFHPDPEQLSQYVQGGLSPSESLLVSTHCDMCNRCKKIAHQQTLIHAENFERNTDSTLKGVPGQSDSEFNAMLSRIVQLPEMKLAEKKASHRLAVELDGRRFVLPKTLRKFIPSIGNWSGLVGRLWQAPINIGGAGAANLIYMGQGGSIPEHTHQGIETTLVLKGNFEDGIGSYQTGDFIRMDGNDTHAPYCHSAQGCLIFSMLDHPLHFTSGVARLISPFSNIFFR